jgi:hypothetical protein
MLVSMIANLFTEPAKGLEFLEKVLLARNRLGAEASLCLDMDVVIVKLKMGNTKDAKEALETAKVAVQSMNVSEPVVFSRYYMASAEYRKVRACREVVNSAFLPLSTNTTLNVL